MIKDIDLAYHWPRIVVGFLSTSGIFLGLDKMMYNGLLDAIIHLYFDFSRRWTDYIYGSTLILINLVSLFAALNGSHGSAALTVNILPVHFLGSPFLWSLLLQRWSWGSDYFSWFEMFMLLLVQFVLLCFRAWATIVMWRDTRGLARNAWGVLVNEKGVRKTTVHPAPVQSVQLL